MHPSPYTSKRILDYDTSPHITDNLDNLSLYYPYSRHDVLIGDGNSHCILHIGLVTLHVSSNSLTLKNVLCVSGYEKELNFYFPTLFH